MQYSHTQQGYVTKISLLAAVILCVVIASTAGGMPVLAKSAVYGIGLMFLVLAWIFGSLTVEVDGEELRHYFGPGFWRKTYLVHEIEDVTVVKNLWIYGWGIRLTPHGWLYNVSGLGAVQVHLQSSRKFRIGTDEPDALKKAIDSIR